MVKAIRTESDAHSTIFGLVETIEKLGPEHQERMFRIITLLADAPKAVQLVVHEMLRRFLEDPPDSAGECIAEVDAVLAYLESKDCDAASGWDSRRAARERLTGALRYN